MLSEERLAIDSEQEKEDSPKEHFANESVFVDWFLVLSFRYLGPHLFEPIITHRSRKLGFVRTSLTFSST